MTQKSASDIKGDGGTCEKVSTDFWVCTDKNGKEWWCSDNGDTCVEAPARVGISGDHLADVAKHLNDVGPDIFRKSIRDVARRGIALQGKSVSRPHGRIPSKQREFIKQVDHLLLQAADAETWNERQITEFALQLSWAKLGADLFSSTIARDNGPGLTASTRCEEEYDQCMVEHNCTTSTFCICCTPCSLQYIACMAGMFRATGGSRGPVIA
jgi:hypothetical protein